MFQVHVSEGISEAIDVYEDVVSITQEPPSSTVTLTKQNAEIVPLKDITFFAVYPCRGEDEAKTS